MAAEYNIYSAADVKYNFQQNNTAYLGKTALETTISPTIYEYTTRWPLKAVTVVLYPLSTPFPSSNTIQAAVMDNTNTIIPGKATVEPNQPTLKSKYTFTNIVPIGTTLRLQLISDNVRDAHFAYVSATIITSA